MKRVGILEISEAEDTESTDSDETRMSTRHSLPDLASIHVHEEDSVDEDMPLEDTLEADMPMEDTLELDMPVEDSLGDDMPKDNLSNAVFATRVKKRGRPRGGITKCNWSAKV